jgi:hypothetical protein
MVAALCATVIVVVRIICTTLTIAAVNTKTLTAKNMGRMLPAFACCCILALELKTTALIRNLIYPKIKFSPMPLLKNLLKSKFRLILMSALLGVALLTIAAQSYSHGKKRVNSTTNIKRAIAPAVTQTNLIDDPQFFVQEQYRDFLNREPDPSGLAFWMSDVMSCGSDVQCAEVKRINVSAAFFLSIEFQNTGYLVYRTYKAAFGNIPNKPVPVTREEMLPDMQEIGNGIVVNQGNWEQQLELNKQAYFNEFVTRGQFTTLYPATITPGQYVDALNTNVGVVLSPSERDSLVNDLKTNIKSRAQVLRAVAENTKLVNAEFNKAFVLMQYFGYLRRNPDDLPDHDFSGWQFWLNKLNQFNGNFVQAEMVKAFLSATEYRQRFQFSNLSSGNVRVEYPSNLTVVPSASDTGLFSIQSSPQQILFGGAAPDDTTGTVPAGYAITVSATPLNGSFDINQWLADTEPNATVDTISNIIVSGIPSFQVTFKDEIGAGIPLVIVPTTGKVYEVSLASTYEIDSAQGVDAINNFNAVLQTLKITQ